MNLESMVEHCEACGVELEISQIGLCGDCQSRNEFCDECGSELEDGQTGLCAECLRKSDVVADVTGIADHLQPMASAKIEVMPSSATHQPEA